MSGHRVDTIAKALAAVTTRRRVLRGLLGGSAGAWAAMHLADAPARVAAQSTTAGVAEAINAYRQSKGLPPIPVSVELTKVAQAHVNDLATYHPEQACNGILHSWSTNGNWTGGCYDPNNQATWPLMWNKPKEIANYPSNGYEIAAWATPAITADQAVALWQSDAPHDDVILNHGIWAGLSWQAIGGWVANGYACAWFGEIPGTPPTPPPPQAPAGQTQTQSCPWGPKQCLPGYVWRVAKPDDLVCVSPDERDRVAEDNAHAAERVDPDCAAGTKTCQYGPSQCLPGYVWRDAWDGDAVCVTPDRRDQAHSDNAAAAGRVDPACAAAAAPQTLANAASMPGSGGAATPGATPVASPGATPIAVSTEPMATAEMGPPPVPATSAAGTVPATGVATESPTAPPTEASTNPATAPATESATATTAP